MINIGEITLYSVEDLADFIGYSESWIRYKLRRGEINGKKLGGVWVTTESQLMEYLKKDLRSRGLTFEGVIKRIKT